MGLLTKAWTCYRELGPAGAARRVRRALWSRERYAVFRKALESPEPSADHDDIVFREAGLDDVTDLCRVWPGEFRYVGPDVAAALRRRMAAGEVCIVGHAPGSAAEPVYMCWLSRRDNSLQTLLGAPPPEGEACVKNVWVHPDRRRRGIAVCGERYAIGAAQRHGVRRLWAFIMPSNTASIVLHERLGFGRAGELVFGETLARRWAAFEEGGLRRSLTLCPADARVL